MSTLCGADCSKCQSNSTCKGCEASGCKPFGKTCFVSEYIKLGGLDKYNEFKAKTLDEVNELLTFLDIPRAEALYELCGEFVNLPYNLPNDECVAFLDNQKIYLGSQIELADMGICYGVVADASFILVCSYSVDGSSPELIAYKRR